MFLKGSISEHELKEMVIAYIEGKTNQKIKWQDITFEVKANNRDDWTPVKSLRASFASSV